MKKIIIAIFLFMLPTVIWAATPTPSPSPNPTATKKDTQVKIDSLKERLATKAAELRKTSPKAIFGSVTQVSVSNLTVDTAQKAVKIELNDDIEVYQILKGKRTKLTIDDVSKNDVVTIVGEYDEILDIITAKYFFIESLATPKRINGFISSIDKKNNAFKLKGIDNTTYTVDVESTTKTQEWSSEDGQIKSGFSKLAEGSFVSIWGTEDEKIPDQYEAIRILIIKSQQAKTISPSPMVTQRATVSATPKNTIKPTPTKKTQPTIEPEKNE